MAHHPQRGFTFEQVKHLVQHETYATSTAIKRFPSADTLTIDSARELINLRDTCAHALLASGDPRVLGDCSNVLNRSAGYRKALDQQENGRIHCSHQLAFTARPHREAFLNMFEKERGARYDMSLLLLNPGAWGAEVAHSIVMTVGTRLLRRCSDPAALSHPLLIAMRDWDKWTKAAELGAYYRARALKAAVTHPHAREDEAEIGKQLVDIKNGGDYLSASLAHSAYVPRARAKPASESAQDRRGRREGDWQRWEGM